MKPKNQAFLILFLLVSLILITGDHLLADPKPGLGRPQPASGTSAPGVVITDSQALSISEDVDGRLPDDFLADAQSTSGPLPPEGLERSYKPGSSTAAILPVPAYLWYRGCGPTAAGMVLGYWDGNGFEDLVSGSAATQTPAVDAMISSTGNWIDYCLPLDYWPDPIAADKSEPPVGDEHLNDSVADYMFTSQSARSNYYGWSWFSHVDNALFDYVAYAAPAYVGYATNKTFSDFSWQEYKDEIDAGRPVVFLVDSDGNGSTDHFVTGIGYDVGTPNQYGCLDTWDTPVRWEEFTAMSSGQVFGIYGVTLFQIAAVPDPSSSVVINEVDHDTPDAIEFYNRDDQPVNMSNWELLINGISIYTFPNFILQPGAYVVVEEGGNPADNTQTKLFTGVNIDLWEQYGAVAILDNGDNGVDFVRFGTSTILPPVGTNWIGTNPPQPTLDETVSRKSTSIDTDDGQDWCNQTPTLGSQNQGCFSVNAFMPLILK